MKKKILRILIITIILMLCIGISRTAFVYWVKSYTKVHFGDEYNEILYPTALDDYFRAKEVLKDVDSYDETSAYPYVMTTYKFPATKFSECRIKSVDDLILLLSS